MQIRRVEEENEKISEFIGDGFANYARQYGVDVNYEDYCFIAEGEDGKILGAINGRAYYNEVHVGDLIIAEECRRSGLGSKLVHTVEEAFSGKCYEKITLTTFGFQALEFYKKLGFQVEFIREDKNPKLTKYFLAKALA